VERLTSISPTFFLKKSKKRVNKMERIHFTEYMILMIGLPVSQTLFLEKLASVTGQLKLTLPKEPNRLG
jgi:hypothetical protein